MFGNIPSTGTRGRSSGGSVLMATSVSLLTTSSLDILDKLFKPDCMKVSKVLSPRTDFATYAALFCSCLFDVSLDGQFVRFFKLSDSPSSTDLPGNFAPNLMFCLLLVVSWIFLQLVLFDICPVEQWRLNTRFLLILHNISSSVLLLDTFCLLSLSLSL